MLRTITRQAAWELLQKYNEGAYRFEHALIMERTLRFFAEKLGYANEAEFWGVAGLLHDLDYELYPEQHCLKEQDMMREEGLCEALIRATASHGWGNLVTDIKPEHTMEKVLYLANELTVLIWNVAKTVPTGSISDVSVDMVMRAYHTPEYASTYPHLVIERGCEMLDWTLEYAAEQMIYAMRGWH